VGVLSTLLAGSIFITACNKNDAPPQKTESSAVETEAVDNVPKIDLSGMDLANGEQIYNGTCTACHTAGVLNAPKPGDKNAWAPRIAQGLDTLFDHSLNGVGTVMQPKGGNPKLSDEEVKNAVAFMVSKSL
jgi:cytochrome c5